MTKSNQDLEIGVDIGAQRTPRLRFSVAGQSTNVALSSEGATRLGASLLTSAFLCSIGQEIPEGTPVAAGQIPVTAAEAHCDPATNLPTMTVTLMGGGVLELVFSSELAVSGAAALAEVGVKAAQGTNEAPPRAN